MRPFPPVVVLLAVAVAFLAAQGLGRFDFGLVLPSMRKAQGQAAGPLVAVLFGGATRSLAPGLLLGALTDGLGRPRRDGLDRIGPRSARARPVIGL